MENRVNALHGSAGHARLTQICLQKIHFARAEVLPNVTEMAAGQIIDDANLFRAARIPYILLGTTTPSSPRFTVMTWASAAASTDGILLAGKNSKKRTLSAPAAAASI